MNLQGKRLLVLGCTNNAGDVNKYAKENGIRIICAGLTFSDAIKSIADEMYVLDILDREALKNLVKEKNIDGIFVGGNEDIIACVTEVADAVNLPFYSTKELWDLTSNKAEFKSACRKYGIPTTKEYLIRESHFEEDSKDITFPLVLKPVDSCGSKGVTFCENKESLEKCFKEALSNSKSGHVIAEEYVNGDEIVVYYTFCDGNVSITSMTDKYVRIEDGGFNPLSEIYAYPSKYLKQYCETYDESMRKMLLGIGIKNGITSMQGFYVDGEFKFFEMGFRLGGTAQYRYTEQLNGINTFAMMMNFALTGKMGGYDQSLDNAFFSKKCCTLSLLSKGGKVAEIRGLDWAEKQKGILAMEVRYKVGDVIKVTRTVAQFHIRLYLITDTEKEMKDLIHAIQDNVKAYDDKGESMLITNFDTDRLSF